MHSSIVREDLRARLTSPLEVADALGLHPRRVGQDGASILCPWHAERNASCSLFVGSAGDLRVYCHACGEGGDVYSLIAQVTGLDVREEFPAVLHEAQGLVGDVAGQPRTVEAGAAQRRSARRGRPERGLSAKQYHYITWVWMQLCKDYQEGSRGRAYLAERGLLEQADAAGVVALPENGELEVRVVLGSLYQGGSDSRSFTLDDLDAAGVVKLGVHGGYAFRWPEHLICIPWVSENGAITAVQQRYVGPSDPENKYVWPPGRAPRHPFGVDELRDNNDIDVVIVEGALDVLARRELARLHGEELDVIGIASAGSPLAGLPVEKLAGRRVRVGVDRDEAGERAAVALRRALHGRAREVVRVVPSTPKTKDWNDQLQIERATRGQAT